MAFSFLRHILPQQPETLDAYQDFSQKATVLLAIAAALAGFYSYQLGRRKEQALDALRKPRVLSQAQQRQMITILSAASGQSVEVTHVDGDDESFDFARQFATVFRAAGWRVVAEGAQSETDSSDKGGGGVVKGIHVHLYFAAPRLPGSFERLKAALQASSITASIEEYGLKRIEEPSVVFLVGKRFSP